jgi:Uma2 family endonuclease
MKFLAVKDSSDRDILINPTFIVEVVSTNEGSSVLIMHDKREYIFNIPFEEMRDMITESLA